MNEHVETQIGAIESVTVPGQEAKEPDRHVFLGPQFGIESAVSQILACVGEDPRREGLQKTPQRVARMYADLLEGYRQDLEAVVNGARFDVEYGQGEMVVATEIEFASMCEHHMLPFTGVAHVAYVPGERVLGLSKIPRIMDMFARRLQIQERLTNEIAAAIEDAIAPAGVMVVLQGQHSCAALRGVKKHGMNMKTTARRGVFRTDGELQDEFYKLLAE